MYVLKGARKAEVAIKAHEAEIKLSTTPLFEGQCPLAQIA